MLDEGGEAEISSGGSRTQISLTGETVTESYGQVKGLRQKNPSAFCAADVKAPDVSGTMWVIAESSGESGGNVRRHIWVTGKTRVMQKGPPASQALSHPWLQHHAFFTGGGIGDQ